MSLGRDPRIECRNLPCRQRARGVGYFLVHLTPDEGGRRRDGIVHRQLRRRLRSIAAMKIDDRLVASDESHLGIIVKQYQLLPLSAEE